AAQRLQESSERNKIGRNQLVRMRSPVQIWVAAPKIPENFGFRGFFVAKSNETVRVKMWVRGLTHTVTHTQK
ncbi:MAG: hypothetical protein KH440_10670, partial [Oscillospiraceae bacterium]|nr:hypothetical protein [Oscillospiraceae bacterium]